MRSILAKVTDLSATHNENPSRHGNEPPRQVRDNFAGITAGKSCKKRQNTFENRQPKLGGSQNED
jgi:hypothetical protein